MKKCFVKIFLLFFCAFLLSASTNLHAQSFQEMPVINPAPSQELAQGGSTTNTNQGNALTRALGWGFNNLTGLGVAGQVGQAVWNTGTAASSAAINSAVSAASDSFQNTVMGLITTASLAMTALAAFVLYGAGETFDFILGITIGSSTLMDILNNSILICWKIIRDVSNIVIVFSLLYVAIKTIIEGNGFADKKMLAGVLMAAIFINFSLLLTKLVYQLSNSVGNAIVNQIKITGSSGNGVGGFSTGVMNMFNLQTLLTNSVFDLSAPSWTGVWNHVNTQILTSIIFLGLSVLFFVFTFSLAKRFFIFVLLMISSPLGLISFFIPWMGNVKNWWWGQLKGQALYLPAFFIVLYVSMQLMTSIVGTMSNPTGQLSAAIGGVNTQTTGTAVAASLTKGGISTMGTKSGMFIYTMFTYALALGCLILSILLPGKIAAGGAGVMNSFGSWASGKIRSLPGATGRFAGRAALSTAARAGRQGGRVASALATTGFTWNADDRKKKLKDLQERARAGDLDARGRLRLAEGISNRTFDLRNVKALGLDKKFGAGIKKWGDAVDDKKKKMESKAKAEMKRLGYDGMARENQSEVVAAERRRDIQMDVLKAAKDALKNNDTESNRNDVIKAQKELEKLEMQVGKEKNKGQSEYLEVMRARQARLWNRMSASQKAAFKKMEEDMEKKWKEEGKAKQTSRRRTPPPGPGPTPPPPTPPTP